jgi:hypothetical protein
MKEKNIVCEFCDARYSSPSGLYCHQKTSSSCLELQLNKLGSYKYKIKDKTPQKAPKKTSPKPLSKTNTTTVTKKVDAKKEESSDSESMSENEEIPLDSSSDEEEEVDVNPLSDTDDEESKNSDKEDAINFFKNMGATKFDNIKTFKKKYTTVSKEVIDEDSKKENFEVKEGTTNIENRLVDITNMILKLSDSIVSLDNKISRISADNEKKDKEIEKRMKDINVDKIIGKIEDMFSTTIENNIEVSKKMLAEIDSKNETLEILKEDIDETCDKYYEIYKKFKNIKEDMEDMFRSRRK